jgi:hypothetical protein
MLGAHTFDLSPIIRFEYRRGVSTEEPIIGDGANSSYDKGQVRYWRSTLHDGNVEYFRSPYIRTVPDF